MAAVELWTGHFAIAATMPKTACDPGPEYLYKYCTIANSAFPSAAELLLMQSKLFFPSPADFNDPFDCKFEMTFEASWVKRQRYARELVRAKAGKGIPKWIQKRIVWRGLSQDAYAKAAERFAHQLRHNVGILSLSEKRSDILLWSHYASKHAGVCLELRRSDVLSHALRVTYSEQSATIDFFEIEGAMHEGDKPASAARSKFIERIYLTKARDWEYEREWRLIDATRRGLRSFPAHLVSGIIFGCRTTEADKKRILEWIARGETRPKLYQACEAKGSYGLEIREVSPKPTERAGLD